MKYKSIKKRNSFSKKARHAKGKKGRHKSKGKKLSTYTMSRGGIRL